MKKVVLAGLSIFLIMAGCLAVFSAGTSPATGTDRGTYDQGETLPIMIPDADEEAVTVSEGMENSLFLPNASGSIEITPLTPSL